MLNKKSFMITVMVIMVISITSLVVVTVLKNPNYESTEKKDNPTERVLPEYSTEAVSNMKENNMYDEIMKHDYSKTVEYLLEQNQLEKEYLELYFDIDYQELSNFSYLVNSFLEKEYNGEEINYILTSRLNDTSILLNMEHIDILKFKDVSNFDISKINRYLEYAENNSELEMKDVVTYVNIGIDLTGYSSIKKISEEEASSYSVLVNKYHQLPSDYEPSDLVELSYNNGYTYSLRKEAAEAFEQLTEAGRIDNVIFYPFSAYRSYSTQEALYNNYVKRDGVEAADTYSARAGHSEHQLGLAVDIRSDSLASNLTNEHYKWMLNNSYKYGFIVRYPKGKQFITGFTEEPWHIRYLGVDLATKVHDSGLTYDEYYDLYLETR